MSWSHIHRSPKETDKYVVIKVKLLEFGELLSFPASAADLDSSLAAPFDAPPEDVLAELASRELMEEYFERFGTR